jgi:Flp pilus assembly protein TadD
MRIVLAALALALVPTAVSAQNDQPPPQCRYDAAGQVDYQACLDASTPGSPWHSLSLINLGTRAYQQADFARAVDYYDRAQPGDGTIMYSDAAYHANYAATLSQVGRDADALVQARAALALLQGAQTLPAEVRRRFGAVPVDRELVYAAILPVLHKAGDEQASEVMRAYMALPADDWVSWANRAAVLLEIDDHAAALDANERALQQEQRHPAVLNNQCYILVRLGRAREALSYCESARAAASNIAAIRHSVASAYAALGRCAEADAEMVAARRLDPVTVEYQQSLVCSPA